MSNRLSVVFALLAGLVSLGAVTTPASAAGPYTSWVMRSDGAGDFILGSDSYTYDSSSGIQVHGTAQTLSVSVDGWTLDVDAPGSESLTVGRTYTDVPHYPDNGTSAGLRLAGRGRDCDLATSAFTVRELTVALGGEIQSLNLSFEQHCHNATNAARGAIAWNSSTPPAVVPPRLSVSIQFSGKRVRYHHKVVIDVRVSEDSPVREVGLYFDPAGDGPEQLVKRAPLDATGFAQIWYRPTESGLATVRLAGGGLFPDRESRRFLEVESMIVSRLRGSPRHAGSYSLYPASKDAVMVAALLPEHPGTCLAFRAQFRVRGHWGYDGVVRCVHLDKHSAAGIRLPGDQRLVGIPIRMRAEFRGDDRSTRTHGSWEYLRFTG